LLSSKREEIEGKGDLNYCREENNSKGKFKLFKDKQYFSLKNG
jgi:hypothetical protein